MQRTAAFLKNRLTLTKDLGPLYQKIQQLEKNAGTVVAKKTKSNLRNL